MIKRLFLALGTLLVFLLALVLGLSTGWFGSNENAGTPQAERVLQRVLDERLKQQRMVAGNHPRQILFGDFHVHTTFSYDAFIASLPLAGGDGRPHTVADACDYARYCSALDFWSVNDHAEQITPRMWRETIETVRQCNALAGSEDNPDLVTFLGWEWTQTGPDPAWHFGHKNVILKDLQIIPERPIAAPGQGMPLPSLAARGLLALASRDSRTLDLNRYLAELDEAESVKEIASDPSELFSKLDDWGVEALVIPHGSAGGIYTPPVLNWPEQPGSYHDAQRQTLVDVDSSQDDAWRAGGPGARYEDQGGRRGSVQYLLAMTDFSEPASPRRLNFGFVGSSDNHSARPGDGYKERGMRRASSAQQRLQALPQPGSGSQLPVKSSRRHWAEIAQSSIEEAEHFSAFWYRSGLVAVHADSRRSADIWDALQRKETYATSGPRILLWFDLDDDSSRHPMGSHVALSGNPTFTVRALGALEQKPGCPSHATDAAGRARLENLCQNECYNPLERRRRIERIEVVRIHPQQSEQEAIDPLVENAWRVVQCPAGEDACDFSFTDEEYAASGRDAIYYVRAIEAASLTANPERPGCSKEQPTTAECPGTEQHRAWSSPIFVNYLPTPAN